MDCDGHTSEMIHCTVSNARCRVHVLAELTCKLGKIKTQIELRSCSTCELSTRASYVDLTKIE